VFWVISVYFNIRNTLPKFCPFLLGHPVYGGLQEDCAQGDVEFCYRLTICCRTQNYNSNLFAVGRSVGRRTFRKHSDF